MSNGKSERSGPHVVVLACRFDALLSALRSLTLAGNVLQQLFHHTTQPAAIYCHLCQNWDKLLDTLETQHPETVDPILRFRVGAPKPALNEYSL
jgi:hypothetical protein